MVLLALGVMMKDLCGPRPQCVAEGTERGMGRAGRVLSDVDDGSQGFRSAQGRAPIVMSEILTDANGWYTDTPPTWQGRKR